MNKILLINRIDTHKFKKDRKRIFFLIGKIKEKSTENLLIKTLDKMKFLIKDDIIYKYNGVQLYMKEEEIPMVIKELTKSGIDIYSVYQLYDPLE